MAREKLADERVVERRLAEPGRVQDDGKSAIRCGRIAHSARLQLDALPGLDRGSVLGKAALGDAQPSVAALILAHGEIVATDAQAEIGA